MLTIKLPYSASEETTDFIKDLQKQYSRVIRSAYKRSMLDWKEIDIRRYCREVFGGDSWFLQSALKEGIFMGAADKATGRKKRIFGGKGKLKARTAGKLSKTKWQETRLLPLSSIGEATQTGNRKLKFNVIENNSLIFKISRNIHYELKLPKLRKVLRSTLEKLELASKNKQLAISFKLTHEFIFISYEETKLNEISICSGNNFAGLDLNPNYIGLAIEDKTGQKIEHQLYSLKKLTCKSGEASTHTKSKYLESKLQHETIEVAKSIVNRLIHNKVSTLTIEDLSFKSGDKGLGKNFNRLTQNKWKRNLFVAQITKRCKAAGIKIKTLIAAYSSFIGNLQHSFPDPINAALEMSRRGRTGQFYPKFELKKSLENQWKEDLGTEVLELKDWKRLYLEVKNSKLKYRVPVPDTGFEKFMSKKSGVTKVTY